MDLKSFNQGPSKTRNTMFSLEVDMKKTEARIRRQLVHDLRFNAGTRKSMPLTTETFNVVYTRLREKQGMTSSKAAEMALREASKKTRLTKVVKQESK